LNALVTARMFTDRELASFLNLTRTPSMVSVGAPTSTKESSNAIIAPPFSTEGP